MLVRYCCSSIANAFKDCKKNYELLFTLFEVTRFNIASKLLSSIIANGADGVCRKRHCNEPAACLVNKIT